MMVSMGNWARRAAFGAAAMGTLLLSACGGGTEQITPFAPTRMYALGDEMSVLTGVNDPPRGRKYSINAISTTDTTQLDCVALPIWHQPVAYSFAFAYAECNPTGNPVTAARTFAFKGAKVADMPLQLAEARLASGRELSNTDLFTLLVGANDVIEVYETIYLLDPTTNGLNAGLAELRLRGVRLAAFVNELTRANVGDIYGPKIVLSTIPLMNLTPYAFKEAANRPGLDVLNVLNQFSVAFNTALRAGDQQNGFGGIVNDGRFIGLVELDSLLTAGVNNPAGYGLVNTLQAACNVPLPDCTQSTLVTGANAANYLWASDLWMGPTAHLNLGNFARGRATGNPF
jgi:hypothetical protein